MRVERRTDRRGIAGIDCDGMDAVMDQPEIIVFKCRNGENTQLTHDTDSDRKAD